MAPGLQSLVYFGRSFGAGHSGSPILILLSTVFNKEPLQFTRVTPSEAVIRTLTPD